MSSHSKLILLLIIVSISFSIVGCTSTSEGLSPNTTQVITKEQLAGVEIATRIAEEKILTIFEEYQPEDYDSTYYVVKNRYTSIDNIEDFLKLYYTEEMTAKIVNSYIKQEDVPGIGITLTLNLPEDYITITEHKLTNKDSIKIYNDTSTITINMDSNHITYSLIKLDDRWLVNGKNVDK